MANIKRLISKKGWTGKELGIIELANMATLFKQVLEGAENPQPLVSKEQFQTMLNGIKDPSQGHIYNNYLSIHEWIAVKYNAAQTQLQQAQLQHTILARYLTDAYIAEDVFSYIQQLPAIMTQKQYDEIKAERVEASFKDKDGNELYSNVFNLIERFIEYHLIRLAEDPSKANPLKAIRRKYINKPIKSAVVRSRFCKAVGEGYYTLEDGRRSDEMTGEEWLTAIESPELLDAVYNEPVLLQEMASRRILEREQILNDNNEDVITQFVKGCKWCYYDETPQDLTKWDVLEASALLDIYPADIDGNGDEYSEGNFTASMEDFKAEFPELIELALKEIDKKYFKGERGLSSIPVSEWGTTLFDFRQLYNKGFYGMVEEMEGDANIFDGRFYKDGRGDERALFNGIAILRPSDLLHKSLRIDERGYYVEPNIENSYACRSLSIFFPEAEEYALTTEIIENAKKTLLDAYYYLVGYDLSVDLIIKCFDLPEFEVFKAGADFIAQKIQGLNELSNHLFNRIHSINYQDKELKAKKLQVVKDVFPALDYQNQKPTDTALQIAEEIIGDFSAFKDEGQQQLERLLYIRPQDGEGGLL